MKKLTRPTKLGLLAFLVLAAMAITPTPAGAVDADPIAVRRWLCTFFTADPAARPDLLASAPITFASGSTLQHRQTQLERGSPVHDKWEIGRDFSFWQAKYSFLTGRSVPRIFSLEINGDRGLLLPDEASVLAFFRGFPAPSYEDGAYTFTIVDPENPNDDILRPFVIEFDLQSQDMSIKWMNAEDARNGLIFCS